MEHNRHEIANKEYIIIIDSTLFQWMTTTEKYYVYVAVAAGVDAGAIVE